MTAPDATRVLHLLPRSDHVERWQALVADVARLVGMEPVAEPLVPGDEGPGKVQAILDAAAALGGAVLVLPATGPGGGARAGVRRVLVPFDRSAGEGPPLRWLIRRALAQDMTVEQVHVLTGANRPAIWEGAGHHAQAWHDELRRRHQVGPATLNVRSGEPARVLGGLARTTDLVVACWNGQVTATRALVLRELLAGSPPPLLLLRAARTARAARAAEPSST